MNHINASNTIVALNREETEQAILQAIFAKYGQLYGYRYVIKVDNTDEAEIRDTTVTFLGVKKSDLPDYEVAP